MIAKKKLCACGCGQKGYIWSKGMLKPCYMKLNPPKPINKITPKQKVRIVSSKKYYAEQIAANMLKNRGACICEECGATIMNPTGRNVSHIISGGANRELYLDHTNSFILCHVCEHQWTFIDPSTMKIWPESQRRKEILNLKYYTNRTN